MKDDIRTAKQLIAAAGLKPGWKTDLVTYQTAELPQLAQIVKQAVKAIGGTINVKILTGTQYYSGSPTTTETAGCRTAPASSMSLSSSARTAASITAPGRR